MVVAAVTVAVTAVVAIVRLGTVAAMIAVVQAAESVAVASKERAMVVDVLSRAARVSAAAAELLPSEPAHVLRLVQKHDQKLRMTRVRFRLRAANHAVNSGVDRSQSRRVLRDAKSVLRFAAVAELR